MLTFSIITVVKNNAHGIEKTINSLKLQTFQNYEHIIIDSNSTDNTNEVIKNKINQKIVYIREEDKSIYEALNKANNIGEKYKNIETHYKMEQSKHKEPFVEAMECGKANYSNLGTGENDSNKAVNGMCNIVNKVKVQNNV